MKRKITSILLCLSVIASLLPATIITALAKTGAGIEIGDYIQMGEYYGEPILWRCVDIGVNGPLMLSDKIICLKPFDAGTSANSSTGSHSRDSGRGSWGSNYWADSNIRSWLNSTATAGNVNWLCGNPPSEGSVRNGYNDYANEAGFLTHFTQGEINAMKEVSQKSLVSYPEYENGIYTTGSEPHEQYSTITDVVANYDKAYAEYVTDKMFLMDVKQVNAVYNNRATLGDNYYIGEPTAKAVENSEYTTSSLVAGKKWLYWLRSPYSGINDDVRYVDSDGDVYYYGYLAYDGECGVRPAFYLNTYTQFENGSGSENDPFTSAYVQEPEIEVTISDGTITNNSDYIGEAAVIVAYYDNDGTLTNVTSETVEFAARGEDGDSHIVNFDGTDTHKIYVWNSLKGMKPLYTLQ